MLVKGRDVFLVTGKPIQGFGHNDVEPMLARIIQQPLVTGPEPACATDSVIGVRSDAFPSIGLDPRPANPNLVLDRGIALEVTGIAGVNYSTHYDASFFDRRLFAGRERR
jgi:hypothetical protein